MLGSTNYTEMAGSLEPDTSPFDVKMLFKSLKARNAI
jgi:hypothetical protein